MHKLSPCVALLTALTATLYSHAEPPPAAPTDWSAQALSTTPPAGKGLTLGAMRIVLEKTRLASIQQALGGTISQQGDASTSLHWLCYTLPGMGQRLWLAADEMGGDTVNVVSAAFSTQPPDTNCPAPKIALKHPPALDNGLWLGMQPPQINKLLGKPSYSERDWQVYYLSREQPGKYRGKSVMYNLTSHVSLLMRNSRIEALQAYQSESY